MISAFCSISSLAKLGILKRFPTKDTVLAEIGKLLNDVCQNDEEARQLTAAIVNRFDEWPGPAKVRQLYRSEVATHTESGLPAPCEICGDVTSERYGGGYFVLRDIRGRGLRACRCTCPRGQALAAMDRQLALKAA